MGLGRLPQRWRGGQTALPAVGAPPHSRAAVPAPSPQAVLLARHAGFLQAEARVRHAEGAHGEALACLSRDGRHPAAAFKYARDVLGEPLPPEQCAAFTAAVLRLAPQLLALDAGAMGQVWPAAAPGVALGSPACGGGFSPPPPPTPCCPPALPSRAPQLVLECLPDQQRPLLAQLAAQPDLQFAFLRSLVAIQQREQAAARLGAAAAAAPLKVRRCLAVGPLRCARAPARLPLLLPASLCCHPASASAPLFPSVALCVA